MRPIPVALAALLTAPALLGLPLASADNGIPHGPGIDVPEDRVIVAVIDTGILAGLADFGGYRDQAGVSDPQIVAWWNFSSSLPGPRDTWDDDPITDACNALDHACHGTAVASLIGGNTTVPGGKTGVFPGVKLAIANVVNPQGSASYIALKKALEWAVFEVGADVVLYNYILPPPSSAPTELLFSTLVDKFDPASEIAAARLAGALVVVPLGDDHLRLCPGSCVAGTHAPSELYPPGKWPHTFLVGDSAAPLLSSATPPTLGRDLDPDVVSLGEARVAASGGGTRIAEGAAIAAARAAGWAARLVQADMNKPGPDERPGQIEHRLSYQADDTDDPYALEGFGVLTNVNAAQALQRLNQGLGPADPPLENDLANQAADALRQANTDSEAGTIILVPKPASVSVRGNIGPSVSPKSPAPATLSNNFFRPGGAMDVEAYRVHLEAGERLNVRLTYTHPNTALEQLHPALRNDLDLLVYRPTGEEEIAAGIGLLYRNAILAGGNEYPSGAATDVEIAYLRAPIPGDYTILVEGRLVGPEGQDFGLTASVDGVNEVLEWLGDFLGPDPPSGCRAACFLVG
ncbi:MAG TPA: S8/S53 family peptidase [Candidatus Thermoplasmatota archaeon]|jgi:hypothetical protein|nr:S8/S53 family peptidase [Candidatus Thermoplasmatota archaeon]